MGLMAIASCWVSKGQGLSLEMGPDPSLLLTHSK